MEEDIKNMSKEELLEYLEDISQQLDNIALDQIQFAISELQFFKEEYKKLEKENKKLKDNYKNQIQHTTILAKALNLEEDAPIDEIYAEINNLKTNSIPTSVIQNRLDELDGQIKEFSTYVNESTGEEKQYWKRERAELVGARGALLGLLKIERNE